MDAGKFAFRSGGYKKRLRLQAQAQSSRYQDVSLSIQPHSTRSMLYAAISVFCTLSQNFTF